MASSSGESSQPQPQPSPSWLFRQEMDMESEQKPGVHRHVEPEVAQSRQIDDERRQTEEFMNQLDNLVPLAEDDQCLFNTSFGNCGLWPNTSTLTLGEEERKATGSPLGPPRSSSAAGDNLMGIGMDFDLDIPPLHSSFWESTLQQSPSLASKETSESKTTKKISLSMVNGGGEKPIPIPQYRPFEETVSGNSMNSVLAGASGGHFTTPNSSSLTGNDGNGFCLNNERKRLQIEAHLKTMIDSRLSELKHSINSQFEKVFEKLHVVEKIQIQTLLTENAGKSECQNEELRKDDITEIVREQVNKVKSEITSLKEMVSAEFGEMNEKMGMGTRMENQLHELQEAQQKMEPEIVELKKTVSQIKLKAEAAAETMIDRDSRVEFEEPGLPGRGGGLGAENIEGKNNTIDVDTVNIPKKEPGLPIVTEEASSASAALLDNVPVYGIKEEPGHAVEEVQRKRGRPRKSSVEDSEARSPPVKVKVGAKRKLVLKPVDNTEKGKGVRRKRRKRIGDDKWIALQGQLLGINVNNVHVRSTATSKSTRSRSVAVAPHIGAASTRNGKRQAKSSQGEQLHLKG